MRARISNLLRSLGILYYTDKLRFYLKVMRKPGERKKFLKDHPGVALPPSYLIYESFDLNYESYYTASRETAAWLLDHFRKHKALENINILDWGCGPARIIRHLPGLLDASCHVYGTDYNPRSIEWCRKNLPGINFNLNGAEPPLPYVDNSFDVLYGISIFTHLPEELHYAWFKELVRISRNGAVIFLTLHGDAFKAKLTDPEQAHFNTGKLLIKGNTRVGHRTYAAFHPEPFVREFFSGHQVLEHIPGGVIRGKPQQDIWIVRVVKEELAD